MFKVISRILILYLSTHFLFPLFISCRFYFTLLYVHTQVDELDEYMIEKVGIKGPKNKWPFGQLSMMDAVEGSDAKLQTDIYVELVESRLTEVDSLLGDLAMEDGFLTIYYDVLADSNDCTTGQVLDPALYNLVSGISEFNYNEAYPVFTANKKKEEKCYPKFSNGKVVTIRTEISYLNSPIIDGNGDISFCVRVGYRKNINASEEKELIAFQDTKILGTIDATGVFGTFDTPLDIVGPDSTVIDTTIDKKVDVAVSLCNIKNESWEKKYQLGQNFRLCVTSSDEDYEVETFTEVSCGTDDNLRQFVVGGVLVDPLSKLFLAENGELENDSIAIRSVLTAAFVREGEATGTIPCQGSVTLKKSMTSVPEERNLQAVSSAGSEVAAGGDVKLLETPFEMKIPFATPNNLNNKDVESSAPLPSSTTAAVAIISFVSLFL